MWLIAGLGNPGERYTFTWHNCGFMVLEVLAQRNRIAVSRSKFKGLWGQGYIGDEKVILLRPQTYMNLSGESVRECAQFFKIPFDRILVIYDDIDIPKGTSRYREQGSAGTHNGMRSVVECLGTESFPRIRIGCGPAPAEWDLADYVLSDIRKEEQKKMFDVFTTAAQRAECLVSGV